MGETGPPQGAQLGSMAFALPISLGLTGRRAVVVGGGVVGEDMARTLLEAGAVVTVISELCSGGLRELSRRGELTLLQRAYLPGDLEGAFLAVAATNSPHINARIHAEANERKVLLNAVDDPDHCHFAFPAVVRRGDLQVAVSTGGKAPALARWVGRKLSRIIGPEYGDLVEAVGTVGEDVRQPAGSATWGRRWEQALDDEVVRLVRSGRIDLAAGRIRSRLTTETPEADRTAPVAIVGAGPGDGGLLPQRARQLLDEADVVVFDRLVSPDLIEGKQSIYVGKEPGKEPGKERGSNSTPNSARLGPTQTEINMLLVLLARQGKRVVRLKGGDPFVFGRGAEEAEALAAEGIDFEIVPAPTSAIAALAYAGIPVTDRRVASSVAIVTGQPSAGRAGHKAREVNWRGLASSADTIVVLMGIASVQHIVTELMLGGLDPATPSAVVENGTTPLQRVITAPIEQLPQKMAGAGLRPPAVIVIGEVVRFRDRIRWFDQDPQAQSPTILPGSAREGQPT
jgi:uroporphyrin-III C-methyltransferase/precorrin-2 dehydrogenase/sirohydrochlorin ferrochelatase